MKELVFKSENGNPVTTTTKVTGKGQIYFVNKFLNIHKILEYHETE